MKEQGFEIVGSFVCKEYDIFGLLKLIGGLVKGRPNECNFEKAKGFAEKLLKKFSNLVEYKM